MIDPSVAPPVITSPGNATALAGTSFTYQATAIDSPAYFEAGGLPAG